MSDRRARRIEQLDRDLFVRRMCRNLLRKLGTGEAFNKDERKFLGVLLRKMAEEAEAPEAEI